MLKQLILNADPYIVLTPFINHIERLEAGTQMGPKAFTSLSTSKRFFF